MLQLDTRQGSECFPIVAEILRFKICIICKGWLRFSDYIFRGWTLYICINLTWGYYADALKKPGLWQHLERLGFGETYCGHWLGYQEQIHINDTMWTIMTRVNPIITNNKASLLVHITFWLLPSPTHSHSHRRKHSLTKSSNFHQIINVWTKRGQICH